MTVRGELVTFKATFESDEGGYADPTTVVVDIIRPDGSLAVSNAAPTRHPSLGQYEHDFLVPLDAPLGRWRIRWESTYLTTTLVPAEEDFEVFLFEPRFADFDEFEFYLGTVIPDDKVEHANEALLNATAAIRAYTRQQLSKVLNDTIVLDPRGRATLWLPERKIIQITALSETVGTVTTVLDVVADVQIDKNTGAVWRKDGRAWTSTRQGISVTYDHGHDPLPQDLIGVCLSHAARAYENPAAMKQEAITGLSRTHAEPLMFTDEEKMILDTYSLAGFA